MRLELRIKDIQHIRKFDFAIDLTAGSLRCLVGKNGVGKTTLVKAIRNISRSDTFLSTSPSSIFNEDSSITYKIAGSEHKYIYDHDLKTIECRNPVDREIAGRFDVELPIPHGQRFGFFQTISNLDDEIRQAIGLYEHSDPVELKRFLHDIYSSNKFDKLVEVKIKSAYYYCLVDDNRKYIREDYLSSGEYFLINLYKKIISKKSFIVVDEIDISLDASAQVKLISWLRNFCITYKISLLFTTHSLALMRTLKDGELFYMEENEGEVSVREVTYNYINSLLFGFSGWDKYILTEDKVLSNFINYSITRYKINPYYKFIVIYIAGASNVDDLVRRNARFEFFTSEENVAVVYDGDQRLENHAQRSDSYCIPFESIEKALYAEYELANNSLPRLENAEKYTNPKTFFKMYKKFVMSEGDIFEYFCSSYNIELEPFINFLRSFLSKPVQEAASEDIPIDHLEADALGNRAIFAVKV